MILKSLPLVLLAVVAGCTNGGNGTETGNAAHLEFSARALNLERSTQTPKEFQAAVTKAELLRSEADTDPAVIFDASRDDVDGALIDLTDADQVVWSGEVPPEYLGTYTHARITVAAAGQVITWVDPAGASKEQAYAEFYVQVDNSDSHFAALPAGVIEEGDVLVTQAATAQWFEIDESKVFSSSAVRSEVTAFQDATPPDPVQVIPLASELIVESEGSYVLRATFDVSNTFEYQDLDSDGAFEPLSDDHDGTMNGVDFRIVKPGLSLATD